MLEVRACGICGSDLHAKDHADELTDVMAEIGYRDFMRGDTPTVMGHEFAGVIAERGPKSPRGLKEGMTVVSFPLVRSHGAVQLTGLSPLAPGAYAERVLVEASLTFPVPNGLSVDRAAMTEPMAVALHAVRRSEIKKGDTAIVIGCGPVGLAVICQLKARGVGTVVASDLSAGRRALALRCGADIVVEASRLRAPEPLLKTDWIKPGAFVVPYGTMSAVELSLTDIMDKMVMDDWGQARSGPYGSLRAHVDSGRLSEKTLHAELGQIVAGLKPGRESEKETNLFWHRGLSLSDIALGSAMLEKAKTMGLGQRLRFR